MKIEDTYTQLKNNLLFSEYPSFSSLRDDILLNFDLSPKSKKNNESLKHLDPHVLDFSYKYINPKDYISFLEDDTKKISINIADGKISTVHNLDKNKFNLEIENINDSKKLIEKKFLNFQKYFDKDYVLNLNSLMLNSGYEIVVGENQEIDIFITNTASKEDLTIFQKNMITCLDNSRVRIIEEFNEDKKSNTNIVNYFELAEDSDVTHLIFQNNKEKANLQSTSYANCKSNSKYKQLIVNISKGSSRNHHYVNMFGDNAYANLDGIFFGSNNQFIDNKTQINHNFPNCESNQCYKGILTDHAKASYLSKTFVKKIAQKTEAYQLSKGILMSEDCYFHSKPELRIFADDVKCSHGSTIGPIDKDLLFYL